MNGKSKLSYEQIQSLAKQLSSTAEEMQDKLNEIKTLFSKVGPGGVWSGTAAEKAKEEFDSLSAKFPGFYQSVEDCSKFLLGVVERYQAVDTSVTNNVSIG